MKGNRPPETIAPAEATETARAGAKSIGCRGASKNDLTTDDLSAATGRSWIVDRFLHVVEVRAC